MNIVDEFSVEVNSRICETGTGEILQDKSESGKVRSWDEKKKLNLKMCDLYQKAMMTDENLMSPARLMQMRDCANYLVFSETEGNKRKLVDANFCRIRLCPMCNWRKSLKMFSQVSEITDVMMSEVKVRFIFLTLTVRNPVAEELTATLNSMNEGLKYLLQKSKNFAPAKKLKENLLGYLKSTEITFNSGQNTYHPHFHILLAVRPSYFDTGYIKRKDYQSMWQQALHLDYLPQVDVRVIKNATSKTIAEMSKYPTKTADLLKIEDEDKAVNALITLHRAMFKRRLVTFGGLFRDIKAKLKLDDIEEGSLVHTESKSESLNAVAYTLFRYSKVYGCYVC